MKKLVFAMLVCAAAQPALAGYGTGTINRYYVDDAGWVYLGLTTTLPGTCSYFIEQFKFSTLTPGGKNLLGTIMSAKFTDKPVTLWYADSPIPGANQDNGCHAGMLAVVTNAGIL